MDLVNTTNLPFHLSREVSLPDWGKFGQGDFDCIERPQQHGSDFLFYLRWRFEELEEHKLLLQTG